MKKTTVAVIAMLVAMLACFIVSADISSTTGDGSGQVIDLDDLNTSGPSMTNGQNYSVGTEDGLKRLATMVNKGSNFTGCTITLENDITLKDGWTPIGDGPRSTLTSGVHYFSGTFDGKGHTIKGLSNSGYTATQLKGSGDETEYVYGLFGFVYNAEIRNLTLDGVNIDTTTGSYLGDSVAPLVGYGLGTLTISNVTTSGSVVANDSVGGVVGRFRGTSLTMTGCISGTSVEAKAANAKVGGMVADLSKYIETVNISGCENRGQITGTNAGGITGYIGDDNSGAVTITITGSTNSGQIIGTSGGTGPHTGGIVGYDETNESNGRTLTITGCTNSATIGSEINGSGTVTSINAGGVIGICQNGTTITGCTNSGKINGNGVGGIVGSVNNSREEGSFTCTISSCTVSGSISGVDVAGGVIGNVGGSTVDIDSCAVSETTTVTTSNHSMSDNKGSVYQGAVNGWAVGRVWESQLTVKNMSETGGKYEFIAAVYFNSGMKVTLENCQTTTLMTWGGNTKTLDLELKNSTIAGLEMYKEGLRITADATSTIGKLIAGADSSILGSGTQPFTPSKLQITVATNTVLRLSEEVTSYHSSTFTGESGSKYTVLTSTSASTKEWNTSANAWGIPTTAEVVASVQYGSVTTYHTSLQYAVTAAPNGSTINVLKSVNCVKTDGKKLTFTGKTLEHTPVNVPGVAATCKDTGLLDGKKCSVCDAIIEEQKIIEKTEHQWDSGVITTQPTKDHEGVRTYTCSVCGVTKTESIPKLCTHVWDSGKVTSDPTCGTAGEKTFECVKCHQTKTEVVAATGNHSWDDGEDTGSGTVRYTCSECGTTKTAKIESDKTEVEKDGVKTTTETQKIEEESKDGTKTVTETTTVSKEENGTVVEKTETTKSTTTSGNTTIESETKVTEKAGERVETSKSTITTEEKTKIVSETTVTEKGDQKTETIAVNIKSEDEKVTTDVSVSDGSTSGIKTAITVGEAEDVNELITSAVKQVDMAAEAISEKVSDVSKDISVATDAVKLSPTSLSAIASSGVSLTITGDAGSIGIDSDVATTMTSQDEDVTISINEKKDGLTNAQKQKAGENKVIELRAYTDNQEIHELGGKARVMIDMTDMDFKSPAVYWLKDDGTSVKVDAEFGEGYAAVELDHFSLYYIAETASSTTFIVIPDTSDDDFPGYVPTPSTDTTDSGSEDTAKIAVLIGAIVVLLMAMVALTHKSR